MRKSTFFLLLFLILVVVGLGAFNYLYKPNLLGQLSKISFPTKKEKPTPTIQATPIPTNAIPKPDFVQTGNLVNTDPTNSAHGPDFSLLYEKPGSPAIKVKLSFAQESQCDFGKGYTRCTKDKMRVGDRVKIQGTESGGQVTVLELVKLP